MIQEARVPATVVQDWVSATTGSAASPASLTVNLGVTATAGNTLLVAVTSDATVSTPTGYTSLVSSIHNAGCYLFGKVSAGSETGVTVTPAVAASTSVAIAEIGGLSGATIANQLDQTVSNGTSTGQNTRSTGTTGTTSQADEYAVAVWGYTASVTVADFTAGGDSKWISQSNSFVEKVDVGTTKTSGTNVGVCVGVLALAATGTVESTAALLNTRSVPAESLAATFKVAAGGSTVNGTASVAGAGAVSANTVQRATATTAGAGAISAAVLLRAGASQAGAGTVAATSTYRTTASVAGTGTVAASVVQRAGSSATATGAVSATAGPGATSGTASVTGVGSTLASALVVVRGTASVAGAGQVTAAAGARFTLRSYTGTTSRPFAGITTRA